jgi:hypothetical protein
MTAVSASFAYNPRRWRGPSHLLDRQRQIACDPSHRPNAANKNLIAQEFYIAWAHVSLAGRVGERRFGADV